MVILASSFHEPKSSFKPAVLNDTKLLLSRRSNLRSKHLSCQQRIKEVKKLRQRFGYSCFACKSSWILITSLDLWNGQVKTSKQTTIHSLLIQTTIKMKVAKSSGKSQGNGHPLIEICQKSGDILDILLKYFYFEPKHLRLWNNIS